MNSRLLSAATLLAVLATTGLPAHARFENDPSLPVAVPAAVDAAEAGAGADAGNEGAAAKSDETPGQREAAPREAGGGIKGIVVKQARAHGVPAALALAVVTVESNFNPGVTGRAGEVGLMQIKPATARGIGYGGSAKGLYDPATNVRWGMKYLAGAYSRAGGDVCGTIMRYQGGHYATRLSRSGVAYCARVKRLMAKA